MNARRALVAALRSVSILLVVIFVSASWDIS